MKIPSVKSAILNFLEIKPNNSYTTNQIYNIIKDKSTNGLRAKSQAVSSRCSKLYKDNKIFRNLFLIKDGKKYTYKYSFNNLNLLNEIEKKNTNVIVNTNILLNEIIFPDYDINKYGPLNFYDFNKNLKEIFIEYIDYRGIKNFNCILEELEEIILNNKKELFYYKYNKHLIKFKCIEQDSTIITYVLSINLI